MDKFKEIINSWYDNCGDKINAYNRELYLTKLFQRLKANDFVRKNLEDEDFGIYILSKLKQNFIDKGLTMTYELIVASEINLAFNVTYLNIEEVKEKKIVVEDKVDDGDSYEQINEDDYMRPDEVVYIEDDLDPEWVNLLQGKLNG